MHAINISFQQYTKEQLIDKEEAIKERDKTKMSKFIDNCNYRENQDRGVGRHIAPPHTTKRRTTTT